MILLYLIGLVAIGYILYAVADIVLWLVRRDRGLNMAVLKPCAVCGTQRPQVWRFFQFLALDTNPLSSGRAKRARLSRKRQR
jgi:hypothetical protein